MTNLIPELRRPELLLVFARGRADEHRAEERNTARTGPSRSRRPASLLVCMRGDCAHRFHRHSGGGDCRSRARGYLSRR